MIHFNAHTRIQNKSDITNTGKSAIMVTTRSTQKIIRCAFVVACLATSASASSMLSRSLKECVEFGVRSRSFVTISAQLHNDSGMRNSLTAGKKFSAQAISVRNYYVKPTLTKEAQYQKIIALLVLKTPVHAINDILNEAYNEGVSERIVTDTRALFGKPVLASNNYGNIPTTGC